MRTRMLSLAALALLGACARAPETPLAAPGREIVCDAVFNQLVVTDLLESTARIAFRIEGGHYTVTDLSVTKAWDGRPELDPWRLFLEGRRRPIAAEEGEVVTLFVLGNPPRPFTIDRASGDLNWSDAGPLGEVEYYGGCAGAS